MKKKLISILAAAAMLFGLSAPAMASSRNIIYPELVIYNGLRYEVTFDTVSNSKVILYGVEEERTSVVVPATIRYKSFDLYVTEIGNLGVYKSSLTWVGIEGSPKISKWAFEGCSSLQYIEFWGQRCPEIEPGAFDSIPSGVDAYVMNSTIGTDRYDYNPNSYPFINGTPLHLIGYDYDSALATVTASQKPGTVLMPGVEYPVADVMAMLDVQATLGNGSAADLTNATVALSDPSGTAATAVVTDDSFTIGKNGTIRVTVTLNDSVRSTDIDMTVTSSQALKKSSLQNSPQNSDILKGQFQMTLSDAQKAQLGNTYDVSFYYRVDPGTLMHNFMVYNTDGTMMADKGNGFYILQGKVKQTGGSLGTSSVQLAQDTDIWSIYYGGELVATCDATNRNTGWHKVTIKYRSGGIGIFVDDVQRTLATVKEGAVSADNYVNTAANYKISKIGPIGTQGWRQPQFSTDADLSGAVNYKTEMGRANFDTFTVTSGGTQVFSYACDSIPSFFSSIWQVKDLNSGNVIYDVPAFDYVWYQN